jgi:hypothetical protein
MKFKLQTRVRKLQETSCQRLKGLAMVESMLAITIIMISIMAPLTISTYTSKYSKLALNRIVGTYLAEEQLEFVVNLRKSLDIYCFNESGNCASQNSFDEFTQMLSLGVGCGSQLTPCYLDEGSIVYSGISKPVFNPYTNVSSCSNLYIKTGDIAKCSGTDIERSPFTRGLIIENIDNLTDSVSGSTVPNGVKLTSFVCINSTSCNRDSQGAVVLIYNIYR